MSYKIIGQYIKKLDFRIPNPKSFSLLSKNIANYKINIDIKSNQLKETMIEIETSLSLKPTKEDSDKIETRIIYSAIIELTDNIKEKSKIEKIILVDVPTNIYPNLREIFIFVFKNSGFKDIKINDKVDFQKLYHSKKNQ